MSLINNSRCQFFMAFVGLVVQCVVSSTVYAAAPAEMQIKEDELYKVMEQSLASAGWSQKAQAEIKTALSGTVFVSRIRSYTRALQTMSRAGATVLSADVVGAGAPQHVQSETPKTESKEGRRRDDIGEVPTGTEACCVVRLGDVLPSMKTAESTDAMMLLSKLYDHFNDVKTEETILLSSQLLAHKGFDAMVQELVGAYHEKWLFFLIKDRLGFKQRITKINLMDAFRCAMNNVEVCEDYWLLHQWITQIGYSLEARTSFGQSFLDLVLDRKVAEGAKDMTLSVKECWLNIPFADSPQPFTTDALMWALIGHGIDEKSGIVADAIRRAVELGWPNFASFIEEVNKKTSSQSMVHVAVIGAGASTVKQNATQKKNEKRRQRNKEKSQLLKAEHARLSALWAQEQQKQAIERKGQELQAALKAKEEERQRAQDAKRIEEENKEKKERIKQVERQRKEEEKRQRKEAKKARLAADQQAAEEKSRQEFEYAQTPAMVADRPSAGDAAAVGAGVPQQAKPETPEAESKDELRCGDLGQIAEDAPPHSTEDSAESMVPLEERLMELVKAAGAEEWIDEDSLNRLERIYLNPEESRRHPLSQQEIAALRKIDPKKYAEAVAEALPQKLRQELGEAQAIPGATMLTEKQRRARGEIFAVMWLCIKRFGTSIEKFKPYIVKASAVAHGAGRGRKLA